MKRFTALFLSCLLVMSMALTSCGGSSTTEASKAPSAAASVKPSESTPASTTPAAPTVSDDPSVTQINVMSFTDEVPNMVEKYLKEHPEVKVKFNKTVVATTNGEYQPALDAALQGGGATAPDLYCAEAAFVLKYTQGDASKYAAAYKDLGIDIDAKIKEAEIAQYTVDIGTRGDGSVVGLGYQATGGAFIYRRSIAKAVWGTEDPAAIKDKIGGSWENFFKAADELKAKGYGIVSGDGDIWHPIENSSDKGWVVDGKLFIDPKREAFLDLAKQLKDGGYSNDTQDWTEAWYADMAGKGKKQIFGFFGPAWLINYTLADHSGGKKVGEGTYGDWAICEPTIGFFWGGTWLLANKDTKIPATVGKIIEWITLDSSETGLQYLWANGLMSATKTKDAVGSSVVMSKSDGKVDFVGGQNIFDVFVPAGKNATGKNLTQFDEKINQAWRNEVREFTAGKKTRDQALESFKTNVASNIDIEAE